MTSSERIRSAHRRLRAWLVDAPIVGGLSLPGHSCPAGLRVKMDLLQPGGSTWFRGAMHALTRDLGSAKGLVAHGAFRPVLAWTTAAAAQRVPVIAVLSERELAVDGRVELLRALGAGVEVQRVPDAAAAEARAAELRTSNGYRLAVGPGDEEFDDGLATLGVELADQLPSDVERVMVAPAALARPIAVGLAACEREVAVAGVDAVGERRHELEALARSVGLGLRLRCEAGDVAALASALEAPDAEHVCVVLAG